MAPSVVFRPVPSTPSDGRPRLCDSRRVADDSIAQPVACVRCSRLALLRIVDRCADCIADIGLNHPAEYAQWRQELSEKLNQGWFAATP